MESALHSDKEPYSLPKEPYSLSKEPYILTKEPYSLSKALDRQHSQTPCYEKCSTLWWKSPIVYQKSPIFCPKKKVGKEGKSSNTMRSKVPCTLIKEIFSLPEQRCVYQKSPLVYQKSPTFCSKKKGPKKKEEKGKAFNHPQPTCWKGFVKKGTYSIKRGLDSFKRGLNSVERGLYSVKGDPYSFKRGLEWIKRGLYSVKRGQYSVKRALYSITRGPYSVKRGLNSHSWVNERGSLINRVKRGLYSVKRALWSTKQRPVHWLKKRRETRGDISIMTHPESICWEGFIKRALHSVKRGLYSKGGKEEGKNLSWHTWVHVCTAVCFGVLQCVAVCCGELRCVAMMTHLSPLVKRALSKEPYSWSKETYTLSKEACIRIPQSTCWEGSVWGGPGRVVGWKPDAYSQDSLVNISVNIVDSAANVVDLASGWLVRIFFLDGANDFWVVRSLYSCSLESVGNKEGELILLCVRCKSGDSWMINFCIGNIQNCGWCIEWMTVELSFFGTFELWVLHMLSQPCSRSIEHMSFSYRNKNLLATKVCVTRSVHTHTL